MQQNDQLGTMTAGKGAPPQPAIPINAQLTGRWNGKAIVFECDFDPPWNGQKDIKLCKDSGPHKFMFHLKDPDHIGLKFDTRDVLWVDETTNCPPAKGINTDQISDVQANANLATFVDENYGAMRKLSYALNVTSNKGPGQFDPIIENGGGIRPLD